MAASRKRAISSAPQTNAQRDAATLARLESWIDEILDGHVTCTKCESKFPAKELQPSAVALLKARYDKLRPSLSAVEQTNVNPDDKLDDSALLDRFKALIAANPDLLQIVTQSSNNAPITPCADAQTGVNTVTH